MPALILIVIVVVLLLGLRVTTVAKPVIYLYPERQEDVLVQLDYVGKITADYPAMDPALGGWKVNAYPDGHLVDTRDGREYSDRSGRATGGRIGIGRPVSSSRAPPRGSFSRIRCPSSASPRGNTTSSSFIGSPRCRATGTT